MESGGSSSVKKSRSGPGSNLEQVEGTKEQGEKFSDWSMRV